MQWTGSSLAQRGCSWNVSSDKDESGMSAMLLILINSALLVKFCPQPVFYRFKFWHHFRVIQRIVKVRNMVFILAAFARDVSRHRCHDDNVKWLLVTEYWSMIELTTNGRGQWLTIGGWCQYTHVLKHTADLWRVVSVTIWILRTPQCQWHCGTPSLMCSGCFKSVTIPVCTAGRKTQLVGKWRCQRWMPHNPRVYCICRKNISITALVQSGFKTRSSSMICTRCANTAKGSSQWMDAMQMRFRYKQWRRIRVIRFKSKHLLRMLSTQ
jgi:hypothetical protein